MTGLTDLVREQIIEALMRAAVHASEIASRPHIVPETRIRIGEFVTSLRRELPGDLVKQTRYSAKDGLCQPDLWADVLVVTPGTATRSQVAGGRGCSISGADLISMVEEATNRLVEESNPLAIKVSMSKVDDVLKEQEALLRRLDENDKASEQVIAGFEELDDKMTREAAEAEALGNV